MVQWLAISFGTDTHIKTNRHPVTFLYGLAATLDFLVYLHSNKPFTQHFYNLAKLPFFLEPQQGSTKSHQALKVLVDHHILPDLFCLL